ncbi:MAG: ribbon-helix-helix protein, CopG family [Chloroflexi bacterium]|nr:ribbon-helix-helix protein, CopG family [Chloroflexota bacterium]
MHALTERLEVRLPKDTMRQLREEAQQRNATVSQLVREAIETLLVHDSQARIHAAEALFRIEAPVADWPEMEDEIERAHIE